MNDVKVIAFDETTATIEGFDGRRWMQMQLDVSNAYAKHLIELAKKGMLKVPWKLLRQLFEARGVQFKMVTATKYEVGSSFLSDVSSGFDDESLSIKSLSRRGYDSDGSVVSFHDAPLWPAAIFDAPQDDDPYDLAATRKTIAIIASSAYTRAFEKWFSLSAKMQDPNVGYSMLDSRDKKALSEGVDQSGGYFVPADVSGDVLSRVSALSVVRSRAHVVPTTRDRFTCPAFAANTTAGSTYASNFIGTWQPEVPLWSDIDPGFEVFEASVKKLRVGTRLSRDFAQDAGGLDWLITEGSKDIAAREDQVFLNGANSSVEPSGILTNVNISTTDVEGSISNTISNSTSADGSASKLLTLAGSLPSQHQRDAVLVTASATEASVNKLVDANRRFLFPRQRGPDGRRELLGYPVEDSPHMPLEGTDANKVVLIGDMSGYLIATRSLLTVRLLERFADTDQIGVILIDRLGAAVHNVDAFRAGVV